MQAVISNDPASNKSFFVDGPGGTGKTYVLNVSLLINTILN